MTSPMVSVILPTFNRLKYLRPAVESIFAQTLTDWELIVADDGSDSETRSYLESLVDPPRVRVIWLSHTGNCSAVRNAALREARGKYVAFLDSDDVWLPEKLELQIGALWIGTAWRWNYTGHQCIDESGDEITLADVQPWVPYSGAISEQILRDQAMVCTPSVVAARDLIFRAGCFDEQLPLFEDYDLWLRLLTFSEVGVLDLPLVLVRKHQEHTRGTGVDMLLARGRVLQKLSTTVTEVGLQGTVEELRATNAAGLAGLYAETERKRALRTLFGGWSYSWRHVEWWMHASRVLLKVALPRRLLALYRANRLGQRRDPALEQG
jgi:glycosyltransferase involved in cell wall biosynthesis